MSKHSARSLTVEILTRVEKEGAYANLLLRNGLEELTDGRDRYLATALVNGTLKYRLLLDYALRKFLTKPLSSLPYEVRGILRSGAFQLLFLDKIPAAAAVSEAVELSKQLAGRYSALVNGILRRVAAQGWNIAWPDVQRDAARYLSVRFSHPEWLVRRWLKRWGLEETEALCRLNNEPARTWVRVNRLKTERTPLLNQWAAEGVVAEGGERTPDSFVISGYGSLNRLDSFRQGLFSVQDESSQLVAHIVNPQPGQRVLDACGAPGGKSAHMAELMRNQGWIWAYDLHSSKLTLVEELTERLGVTIVETQQGDARELPSVWERTMDRVLVDAPCSGLGVLRRKADLRWQRDEREIERLPVLQREILESAARCVAADGELVYSTCTTEPEENFELVKAFRLDHPEFEAVDLSPLLPFPLTDSHDIRQAAKGMLQLLPQRHGMDGFFLAKFRRIEV